MDDLIENENKNVDLEQLAIADKDLEKIYSSKISLPKVF